jgi:metal-sulfur cluster biosynthetic enzyme
MFDEEQVREALKVCFDPELPVNIVDLGLVYGIEVTLDEDAPGIDPRYCVKVRLTMRAPNEEREGMLVAQVRNRLAGMQEVSRSAVDLVWEPAWTADRMTPEARKQLGLGRPARQGLVNIQL